MRSWGRAQARSTISTSPCERFATIVAGCDKYVLHFGLYLTVAVCDKYVLHFGFYLRPECALPHALAARQHTYMSRGGLCASQRKAAKKNAMLK
jgi:hypothetical protein